MRFNRHETIVNRTSESLEKLLNSSLDVVDLWWPSNMATATKNQQKMAPVDLRFKIETCNEN